MYGQVERRWQIPVCFTGRQFREHCERTNIHCSAGSWKNVSRAAGNWDRIGGRSGGTEWSQRGKRLRSSRPRQFSLCVRSRVRPPKHLPYSDSKLKSRGGTRQEDLTQITPLDLPLSMLESVKETNAPPNNRSAPPSFHMAVNALPVDVASGSCPEVGFEEIDRFGYFAPGPEGQITHHPRAVA